jgi:hypothetical protein
VVISMMCNKWRISRVAVLSLFFLLTCTLIACSPTPQKSVDGPQGGKIVYGVVEGADTQAAALGKVLRSVQTNCGERPQVGRVFTVRGTDSHAVYFTVVNRPAGNKYVAGLVIAVQSGPGRVEAAMVSDEASRFGSTVNPMLQKLFSMWHPGEGSAAPVPAASEAPPAPSSAPLIPPMSRVTLPDNTASVSIPNGWRVDPSSGGGGISITGPRGERVFLNMWFTAQDPNGMAYKRAQRMGVRPDPHTVIYPYNVDPAKSFPDIFQRLRASNGFRPAELQVDHAQPMPASNGSRCVQAAGRANRDGTGMREFNMMLCSTTPDQSGLYAFYVYDFVLANGATDHERAAAVAIVSSFQANTALINQRVAATMAPVLANMRKNYETQQQQMLARNQRIVNQIKQVGANATARYNATQAANDAQHRAWNNQQDVNSRKAQGFSNYLLDQTVVQDNYRNTHSTEWNRTADALVKANPNRYQTVDNPNYWRGTDYSR